MSTTTAAIVGTTVDNRRELYVGRDYIGYSEWKAQYASHFRIKVDGQSILLPVDCLNADARESIARIQEYIVESCIAGTYRLTLLKGYEHFECQLCGACVQPDHSGVVGGTGYATQRSPETLTECNGHTLQLQQGLTCYDCCARVDKAFMHTHAKNTLYLTKDGEKHTVKNWCATLARPCRVIATSRNNMGATRTTVHFMFNGECWSGENIGDNELLRCKKLAQQPTANYEILNHGYDHSQYFQGCGVAFTRFTFVVTGAGTDAVEAYNDALEQLAQTQGNDVIEALGIPDKPKGYNITKRNRVPHELSKHEDCEHYNYVSIRYNLPSGVVAR